MVVTGKLNSLMFGADGEQYITFSVREDFREEYENLKDSEIDITIKKHRHKRSLDANSYAWVLIDRLAEKLKLPKEEIYRNAIKSIGGVSVFVCVQEKAYNNLANMWTSKGIGWQVEKTSSKIDGCVNAILYYGSSVYDTAQMSDLINNLVEDCKAVGIPTLTPNEILELESRWKG